MQVLISLPAVEIGRVVDVGEGLTHGNRHSQKRAQRFPSLSQGGADFLEVVLHRFGSAEGASAAAPFWQIGYVPSNPNEVYSCDSSGAFVVCADGTSPLTPPRADVRALLDQMMAAVT